MDYKRIHIGVHLKVVSEFKELPISRACTFLKCSHQDILDMYNQESIDSQLLLQWCKLLDYNFFMFYQTHLQLYNPISSTTKLVASNNKDVKPKAYIFKKNIYSPELIDWIMDKINKNEISIKEVIEKYKIPRTTIYRWKRRYLNE